MMILKNKKRYEYFLLILAFFIYSFTSVFGKLASEQLFFSLRFIVFYGFFLVILGVYAFLWQQVLKYFPLIIAYAGKALTIIFSMIWGYLLFNDRIKMNMIVGTLIILIGVFLLVKSDE